MYAIIILGVTGFIMSIILVFLDVQKNNKVDFIKYLPGYNCGSCGFGSCQGMCEAMEKNIDNYKKCKPLKGEALKKMEEFVSKYKGEL